MARRRRRGRFNRIRPDMGWWIDTGYSTFVWQDPNGTNGANGTAVSTIQFDDITDDDSLITRDNSDWFIKRVLFEAFPSLDAATSSAFSPKRLITMAVGTIDNDKLAEWVVNQGHDLFSPDGYEMWARILRMYQRPVYQPYTPKIAVDSASTGALAVETSDAETFAWRANMMDWGPSYVIDDIPVSNAGLKPEQSLAVAWGGDSDMDINEPFRWADGDTVGMRWNLRVLLQKRRAA